MNFHVLEKVDFVSLSRRAVGLIFTIYWIAAIFHPFLFLTLFQKLNISFLTWPFLATMLVSSICLIAINTVAVASLTLAAGMSFLWTYDTPTVDLHWPFITWLLFAYVLMEWGIERRRLVELGWFIAGLVLTLHGIAKFKFAGVEWMNGTVIQIFTNYASPRFYSFLEKAHIAPVFCLLGGWFVMAFHVAALPHALIRSSRGLFVLSAFLFHGYILLSPLYFISLGMIPFWLFLCDGLASQNETSTPLTGARGFDEAKLLNSIP